MVSRGQIVVVDFAVAGMPKKVRPVLVVQSDAYNRKMTGTVVAMITTNLARSAEPTRLLTNIGTPDGKQSGVLHTSVVNCDTLTTVRQDDVLRILGTISPTLMKGIDQCLKAAWAIS